MAGRGDGQADSPYPIRIEKCEYPNRPTGPGSGAAYRTDDHRFQERSLAPDSTSGQLSGSGQRSLPTVLTPDVSGCEPGCQRPLATVDLVAPLAHTFEPHEKSGFRSQLAHQRVLSQQTKDKRV